MKDLCLTAVNSDGAITSFDDAMSALSDGPFINWSATADNGSKKILVVSGTPVSYTHLTLPTILLV